jgi:hypothetical protein
MNAYQKKEWLREHGVDLTALSSAIMKRVVSWCKHNRGIEGFRVWQLAEIEIRKMADELVEKAEAALVPVEDDETEVWDDENGFNIGVTQDTTPLFDECLDGGAA